MLVYLDCREINKKVAACIGQCIFVASCLAKILGYLLLFSAIVIHNDGQDNEFQNEKVSLL